MRILGKKYQYTGFSQQPNASLALEKNKQDQKTFLTLNDQNVDLQGFYSKHANLVYMLEPNLTA